MLIIELMKKACNNCGKELWNLFKSQEEFDNFKCSECNKQLEMKEDINTETINLDSNENIKEEEEESSSNPLNPTNIVEEIQTEEKGHCP